MSAVIEMPPLLIGNDPQTLYGYLYRMAEQLNVALGELERSGAAPYSGPMSLGADMSPTARTARPGGRCP